MWHPGLLTLVAVFGTALLVCVSLILTQRWHGKLTLDHDLCGVQKIHHKPVPRIGGLAVFSALLAGGLGALWIADPLAPQILGLLFCSLPAFLAGLIEDLTKRVGVRARLYASFAAAAIAGWILDAMLVRLSTPGLDYLIAFAPISVLFTCFAVAGMTHAINIIDGLNGLAAGCVAVMLSGLGLIAWQVGDMLVLQLSLWGAAALVGFLLVNFPFGRIFLGDGGAYFAGFWLAECGILLLNRNPSVSTWAVLLCCIYPFWETIFSMYRRHVLHRVSSGSPDMVHFHHMVFRLVSRTAVGSHSPSWLKHGLATLSLWTLTSSCVFVAVRAHEDTPVLVAACLSFAVLYGLSYRHIHRTSTEVPLKADPLFQPRRF